MPKKYYRRRKKGYSAADPFCKDKLRIALYNRPEGPHMGALKLGQTQLSGLDNKCFSRTGKFKKGYRNMPFDLEREHKLEKRSIERIQNMFSDGRDIWEERANGKKVLVTHEERMLVKMKKRLENRAQNAMLDPNSGATRDAENQLLRLQQQIAERKKGSLSGSRSKVKESLSLFGEDGMENGDGLSDNAELEKGEVQQSKESMKSEQGEDRKEEIQHKWSQRLKKMMVKPKQKMTPEDRIRKIERREDESFMEFTQRVAEVASNLEMTAERKEAIKKRKRKVRNKEFRLKRKERQKQRQEEREKELKEEMRLKKIEAQREEQAERRWIKFMEGEKMRDKVQYGEVNSKPPQTLHELGAKLIGKSSRKKTAKLGKTAKSLAQQRRSEKMKANYQFVKKQRRQKARSIGHGN